MSLSESASITVSWQELLDALPAATLLLAPGGQVVAGNFAWQKLAGAEGDEATVFAPGNDFLADCAAAFPSGAAELLALAAALQAAGTGQPVGELAHGYRHAEQARCLVLTLSALRLGGCERVLVQARDATPQLQDRAARQLAETELRETQERFSRISAATTEAVVLSDQGRIIDANPAALRMFGCTMEEMIGRDAFSSMVAPESLAEAQRRIKDDIPGTYEVTTLRSDGTHIYVEVTATLVPYHGRTIRGTAARDITERKRTELLLRDSEERFRLLTDISSEALVLSVNGVIIDANLTATRMFRCDKAEMIGRGVKDFISFPFAERALAAIAADTNEPIYCDGRRQDGTTFPLCSLGRRLPAQGGYIRGAILRDLTIERQAEASLRKSIAQEEKLRAQSETLAELSTPLIPINDRIMVMPLIGMVDNQRAGQVLESLLNGITRSGASVAILDITGVPMVDKQVASTLLRAAAAVKLIGAKLILTGIRAEVAQALVAIGADLSGVITHATLQSGIAYAMR